MIGVEDQLLEPLPAVPEDGSAATFTTSPTSASHPPPMLELMSAELNFSSSPACTERSCTDFMVKGREGALGTLAFC